MVSPEEEEVLRVLNLVGEHETDAFDWLFSSVNVVTEEKVVLVARVSAVLKELDQVRELAMNVA